MIKHELYNETFHNGRLTTTVTDWWITVDSLEKKIRATPIWALGSPNVCYMKTCTDEMVNLLGCPRSHCLYPYLAGHDNLLGWLYRRDLKWPV